MAKESFVLYKAQYEPIKNLSLKEKGILFDAIYNYQLTGEQQNLSPVVKMAFLFFKNQFELDHIKYLERCRKNAENGKKGGKQKQANASERYQSQTNLTDNDNDNDNEKGIVKKSKKKKPLGFTPPTLDEIESYISEKKYSVDAKQFLEYFDTGNWIDANGNKVKSWKQKIVTWNKYNKPKTNGYKKPDKPFYSKYLGLDL